jgi:hypothetical protein
MVMCIGEITGIVDRAEVTIKEVGLMMCDENSGVCED